MVSLCESSGDNVYGGGPRTEDREVISDLQDTTVATQTCDPVQLNSTQHISDWNTKMHMKNVTKSRK